MNPNQSTIHIVSANLGALLGPALPGPVLEAAREHLRTQDANQRLRGAWVRDFGEDLHLHLSTFGGDFGGGQDPSAFALDLARGAVRAALACGLQMGLGA